ncbi:MAG: LCP family protein [Candidatus Pacebacteria bacterium]|nr:LCP family protein [Candidatus Paceibacterota bacterium]
MKKKEAGPFLLNEVQKKNKKKHRFFKLKYIFLVFFLALIASGSYFIYRTNSAFDQITGQENSVFKSLIKMLPFSNNFFQILPVEGGDVSPVDKINNGELDRLNVLLLGLRGVDDPNGGLLTDTMMIMSMKVKTGEVALISVPRDLYIDIPYSDAKGKINEAYAYGMKSGDWQEGLGYSENVVEEVTGLDIHYTASVDFEAFKEIIDTLGGVTIYLDRPFSEMYQFEEGGIALPAGENIIDGDTALLFVRARFSSNDFERAKRQQQVLVSVKNKALNLGILSSPSKIISILNSLGKHVRTDAELWEIQELAKLVYKMSDSDIKRQVFDTTDAGLLYETYSSGGAYILLPDGDDYNAIHKACADIFEK